MRILRWVMPLTARAPYALVAALMLVRFADEWVTFFPAGSLEPIRADVQLSYAQAGVVLGALPAGGLIGHFFTIAADYVSRRWLAALGALVYGLCMIAFALADSFVVLVAASFVWGSASDAFVHGCEVALVDLAEEELAPVLARVNFFGAVGDLLGPLTLAGGAAVGLGWRGVFVGNGVLMVLYAGWLASQRFPSPRPPEHASTPMAGVLSVLRDRRVIVLAIVAGLFSLLDEPLLGFTIAYLEQVRGLSDAVATAIASVVVAGGIVGYLVVSPLTRRFTTRQLLFGAGSAVGVAIAGIIVAPTALAQAAAGFSFGVAGAVFWSVVQAAYLSLRPGQAGATQAVVSTIGMFGIAYPALVGAVADARGLTAGLVLYAVVPAVMIALLALFPSAT
ncbi:MAG: MFS transporter, partial [Chloroflexi bacterium]|nr:MFS transporter [Chloroflexota bacterium]